MARNPQRDTQGRRPAHGDGGRREPRPIVPEHRSGGASARDVSAAHRAQRAAARQQARRPAARKPASAHKKAPALKRSVPAGWASAGGARGRRAPVPGGPRSKGPSFPGPQGFRLTRPFVTAVAAIVLVLVIAVPWALGSKGGRGATESEVRALSAATGTVEEVASLASPLGAFGSAVGALQEGGNDVGAYLCSLDGTQILAYNADEQFYGASSIKGPYVLSALADDASGAPGSYSDAIGSTIVDSDNNAYWQVKHAFGTNLINQWLEKVGTEERLDDGEGSYVDLTPRQLAGLWVEAASYLEQSEGTDEGSWAASLFSKPVNSAIAQLDGAVTWSKPGWIEVESTSSTVNAGIIERGGKAYVMAVMTNAGDDFPKLDPVIVALDDVAQELGGGSATKIGSGTGTVASTPAATAAAESSPSAS